MDTTSITQFITSKRYVVLVAAVAVFALVAASVSIGMAVGFSKARHSYEWGENYSNVFGGPRDGFVRGFARTMGGRDFIDAHGTFGQIIQISEHVLTVNGREGAEKQIVIGPETVVRRFRDDVQAGTLRVGDPIVVVGSPDGQGRIQAQLIRVMPTPPVPVEYNQPR